ncbi:MAG: NUDIX domain-containing protein, partial [Persicimonas sp.]
GLLAGLWEFPTVEVEPEPTHPNGLEAYLADQLGSEAAAEADPVELGEFIHHFSHIRMTIRAEERRVGAEAGRVSPAEGFERPFRWVSAEQFDQMAVSAAMRKVFALFRDR